MMMFARRKDGSLNLSIQAIVILVMAMAVLGLGLGFIRGLMGKGEEQFSRAIDNAALENPADATNPVTVDRTVSVKAGKTSKLRIGFYNAETTAVTSFTPALDSACSTSGYTLTSGAQNVPTGDARGYEAVLGAPAGAAAGTTQVCTIQFSDGTDIIASKQFYVDIVS